jgi:hypothetical protein
MDSHNAEHVRALRAQADELRDAAGLMRFRETRAALTILAESYDRMADKLDSPRKTYRRAQIRT